MSYFIVIHGYSYRSLDCLIPLLSSMFKDSKIASELKLMRTKWSEIIWEKLNKIYFSKILDLDIQNSFYSISTDSYSKDVRTVYPVIVTILDKQFSKNSILLSLIESSEHDSNAIYTNIRKVLTNYNININRAVSYSADGASVNYGSKNSVFQKLQSENSKIIKAICHCHILHNTLKYASQRMSIDIELLINKIYSLFHRSSKQTDYLKLICALSEVKYEKITRNCETRWLSLLPAVEKINKLFDQIKLFIQTLSPMETHPILNDVFNSDKSYVYRCCLFFLESVFSVSNECIQFLERSDIYISEIYDKIYYFKIQIEQRFEKGFYRYKCEHLMSRIDEKSQIQLIKDFKQFYSNILL